MKLTLLEPQFVRHTRELQTREYCVPPFERTAEVEVTHDVASIGDAQGIRLLCPKCFVANGGAGDTHSLLLWFRDRGVAEDATPGPGRWAIDGTGYDDLSLSPSVHVTSGCGWHGYGTGGVATDC